jgi:hypothetical protein
VTPGASGFRDALALGHLQRACIRGPKIVAASGFDHNGLSRRAWRAPSDSRARNEHE